MESQFGEDIGSIIAWDGHSRVVIARRDVPKIHEWISENLPYGSWSNRFIRETFGGPSIEKYWWSKKQTDDDKWYPGYGGREEYTFVNDEITVQFVLTWGIWPY